MTRPGRIRACRLCKMDKYSSKVRSKRRHGWKKEQR